MKRSRALYLAVAIFTLGVQVAAAAHSPALHEEPVSKCRDAGAHFCAEVVEQEAGPCVLCQVSLNGVYLERAGAVQILALVEPVSSAAAPSHDLAVILSSHAPRGPPVG